VLIDDIDEVGADRAVAPGPASPPLLLPSPPVLVAAIAELVTSTV